jgi:hypothetical protein
MPATSSGLETFGGGTGGSFGSNPNLTQSNSIGSTPFLGGVANAGVGTGNLGQFGGYIPTPLPQFNNYQDYMTAMPGTQQMDYAASQWNPEGYRGFMQNVQAPNLGPGGASINSAQEFAQEWDPRMQEMINSRWLPAAEQEFAAAGQMYGDANRMRGAAPQFFDNVQQYLSQIPGDLSKAQDIWQQAADPQNALYNRTVQQTQEQQRAALEARGIDMTPYGAGVEGQALSNFNIDWQNNLLQRMLAGGQGVGQMQGAAAQMGQAGGQMAQTGGGLLAGAGALDQGAAGMEQGAAGLQDMAYHASMDSHNAPMEAYKKEQQFAEDQMNQYLGYNQAGSGMWQNIQNQFLTANQQGFNQNQTAGFEDPFAMLQLQSQIEMQREQMNMQEEMQKKQQQAQMMQGAMGMMGGMGGK